MKVYIMRHGEAGYHSFSDEKRALTEFGQQQCQLVGSWFKNNNIAFDLGLVSPYKRAQETFSIIEQNVLVNKKKNEPKLTPGGAPDYIADYLLELKESNIKSVLIVSHLPLVGYLVNELCPEIAPPMFSTANVICISISNEGKGSVEWQHHPM